MTEYETIEKRLTEARAVWVATHGTPLGFYEANKADMDRLSDIFDASYRLAERRADRVKSEKPREAHERALIQLWLPLGQREAFRALCTKQGLSLSAKLRAMIATELGQ